MSMIQAVVREEGREPGGQTEELAARAGIYRLLSGAFAEEAGREFIEALRQPSSLEAMAEAGLAFGPDFVSVPLDRLVDELACEYASLFVAPGGATPVESARLTGRMQQDSYYQVQADYKRLGFSVRQGRFATFDDHLSVELDFVANLLDRSAQAILADDETGHRRFEKEIRRFWALHLGRWARGFGGVVARATAHSFYREMARLLTMFGEDEIARLNLKVVDVDGRPPEQPKPETAGLVCGLPTPPPGAPTGARSPRLELPSELV